MPTCSVIGKKTTNHLAFYYATMQLPRVRLCGISYSVCLVTLKPFCVFLPCMISAIVSAKVSTLISVYTPIAEGFVISCTAWQILPLQWKGASHRGASDTADKGCSYRLPVAEPRTACQPSVDSIRQRSRIPFHPHCPQSQQLGNQGSEPVGSLKDWRQFGYKFGDRIL